MQKLPFIFNSFQLFHFCVHRFESLNPKTRERTNTLKKSSLTAANQGEFSKLNKMIDEIMHESVEAVEEVHLEPQPGEGINVEKGTQLEKEG